MHKRAGYTKTNEQGRLLHGLWLCQELTSERNGGINRLGGHTAFWSGGVPFIYEYFQ